MKRSQVIRTISIHLLLVCRARHIYDICERVRAIAARFQSYERNNCFDRWGYYLFINASFFPMRSKPAKNRRLTDRTTEQLTGK
jgi:hypothetical protein